MILYKNYFYIFCFNDIGSCIDKVIGMEIKENKLFKWIECVIKN